MEALMKELNSRGIKAEQMFSITEESYRSAKNFMQRFVLRLSQYVLYPIYLFLHLFLEEVKRVLYKGTDTGLIVVSTNTFYAPLIATFFNKKVVHLVYDLFPEAMIHSGKWKEGQIRVKFFRWLVGITLKRASCNVFLGDRIKEYVSTIHGKIYNNVTIPVGADERPFKNSLFREEKEEIEILYCGNFGNMHDHETFFDALSEGLDADLLFSFHCSGPKRKILQSFLRLKAQKKHFRLFLGEGLNYNEWIKKMEEAEIALVTMSDGSEQVVMPSKTYSAMMAGQAILAIAPENSDLVDLIKKTDCGWWVTPGESQKLKQLLTTIKEDKVLLKEKEKMHLLPHKYFSQSCLAEDWISLFHKLEDKNRNNINH